MGRRSYMRFVFFAIVILGALCLAPLSARAAESQKGDVYNFYFQKAPGPKTVSQGTQSTADRQAEDSSVSKGFPEPNAELQEAQAPNSRKSNLLERIRHGIGVKSMEGLKEWELGAGYAYHEDQEGNFLGLHLHGQHNLSRYIGLALGISIAPDTGTSGSGYKKREGFSAVDLSLMGWLTPIHIKTFSHNLLEVGFGVGALTGDPREEPHQLRSGKEILATLGVRVGVNLAESLGVIAETRTTNQTRAFESNLSLRHRF